MAKARVKDKPVIGLPGELEALRESCKNAQDGNLKLARAIDALRTALETIVIAEWDSVTQAPTTPKQLRQMAVEGLDAYSALTGQNWKRHKLIGNWAGDRSTSGLDV